MWRILEINRLERVHKESINRSTRRLKAQSSVGQEVAPMPNSTQKLRPNNSQNDTENCDFANYAMMLFFGGMGA